MNIRTLGLLVLTAFPVFPFFRNSFWASKFFLSGILVFFLFLKKRREVLPGEILFFFIALSAFLEKGNFFIFFWFFLPLAVFILARDGEFQKNFWESVSWLVLIISILAIAQFFTKVNPFGAPLPYVTFGNPMYLGSYLACLLPLVVEKKLVFFLGLFALLLTGSQSALLGFFAGFLYLEAKSFNRRKIFLFLSILVLTAAGYFSFILKRDVNPGISLERRKNYYTVALKMISEKPFTGVGFGNFRGKYQQYRLKTKTPPHISPRWAHNDILHFLAEGGIRGLVLVAIILGIVFKKVSEEKKIYKAALIAIFFNSLLGFPLQRISTIILFALFAGKVYEISPNLPLKKGGIKGEILRGISLLGIFYLLFFGWGEICWKNGEKAFKNGNYAVAASEMEKARKIFPENWEVLFDLARSYYRNGDLEKSLETYGKCLEMYLDWDICYNLSLIFGKSGNMPAAEEFFILAKKINPEL